MHTDIQKFVQAVHTFIDSAISEQRFQIKVDLHSDDNLNNKLDQGSSLFAKQDFEIETTVIEIWIDELMAIFYLFLPERENELHRLQKLTGDSNKAAEFFFALQQKQTENRQLAVDLVSVFRLFLVRPILQQLAMALSKKMNFNNWQRGFCPVCGNDPALGFILEENGQRRLWCAHCTTSWYFPRLQCAFCGEQNQSMMHYFEQQETSAQRLKVCDHCRHYIRENYVSHWPGITACDEYFIETTELEMLATIGGYLAPAIDDNFARMHFQ